MTFEEIKMKTQQCIELISRGDQLSAEIDSLNNRANTIALQSARVIKALAEDSGENRGYTVSLELMVHNLKLESSEVLEQMRKLNAELTQVVQEAKALHAEIEAAD